MTSNVNLSSNNLCQDLNSTSLGLQSPKKNSNNREKNLLSQIKKNTNTNTNTNLIAKNNQKNDITMQQPQRGNTQLTLIDNINCNSNSKKTENQKLISFQLNNVRYRLEKEDIENNPDKLIEYCEKAIKSGCALAIKQIQELILQLLSEDALFFLYCLNDLGNFLESTKINTKLIDKLVNDFLTENSSNIDMLLELCQVNDEYSAQLARKQLLISNQPLDQLNPITLLELYNAFKDLAKNNTKISIFLQQVQNTLIKKMIGGQFNYPNLLIKLSLNNAYGLCLQSQAQRILLSLIANNDVELRDITMLQWLGLVLNTTGDCCLKLRIQAINQILSKPLSEFESYLNFQMRCFLNAPDNLGQTPLILKLEFCILCNIYFTSNIIDLNKLQQIENHYNVYDQDGNLMGNTLNLVLEAFWPSVIDRINNILNFNNEDNTNNLQDNTNNTNDELDEEKEF